MPDKPVKTEKKPEDDIEIIPSEKPQPVEIEIDSATGKPVSEIPPAAPSFSTEDLRKLEARLEYQRRQDRKEMLDLLSKFQVPAPTAQVEKPEEKFEAKEDFDPDLHAIAQTNYQKAIGIKSRREAEQVFEEKFKAKMEERDRQTREQMIQQNRQRVLQMSMNRVLTKAPALNDETSEEFKGFYSVWSQMKLEDPELETNPRAPELVYSEWKEKNQSKESSKEVTDPESERLKRVMGTAAPQGRPISSSKTFKLTQEELDMCNEREISPALYAQMKEADLKQGVIA